MVHLPRWSSPVSPEEMTAGDGAATIEFIQRHCRITKDSIAGHRGQRIELRDWQQLQIYRLLARSPETGLRIHRTGLFGVPRKNGKSELSAGFALSEADQGPSGGEVVCCAGDRDQARIVFGTAKQMVSMDPELAARVKTYRDELVWPETETRLKVVSADAKLKEGYNPTLVVFDEVHVQPTDELWDVMEQALGARVEPLIFGITTAGDPTDRFGADSLCFRLYQYGLQVAKGEIDDPTFFFAWWEPHNPAADWRDPATWAEANPGLGDIVSLADFEAKTKRGPEAVIRTKRLNTWVVGKQAALPAGSWDALATIRPSQSDPVTFGSGIEVSPEWLEGSILFLDGSWSGDSTGLVGCTPDGFLFVVTHHEKTDADGPDWRVPVTSVEADIRLAFTHKARGLLLDPHRWQRTASVLAEEGYPVAEWPTNSLARIIPAWSDFYKAIIDADGISHDGNLAMARHAGNIVLKIDAHGARPVKTHKTSRRHIDLAICAIGAWANRTLEFDTGAPTRAALWSDVA